MEWGKKIHALWTQEEVIVVHDREPVPMVDSPNAVIKGHSFDIERGKDGFLIRHGRVIMTRHLTINYEKLGVEENADIPWQTK